MTRFANHWKDIFG